MRDDDLTRMLGDLAGGGSPAANELLERVYPELRAIAARVVGPRRHSATLQPTALVHEAYLRLASRNVAIEDRGHFFALAARIMRCLLVDSARRRQLREGMSPVTVELGGGTPRGGDGAPVDLLDLDAALVELGKRSARQLRVIEMRYFGGLEIEQAAAVLGVSHATVERDWQAARAWLGARLSGRRPA